MGLLRRRFRSCRRSVAVSDSWCSLLPSGFNKSISLGLAAFEQGVADANDVRICDDHLRDVVIDLATTGRQCPNSPVAPVVMEVQPHAVLHAGNHRVGRTIAAIEATAVVG